MTNESHPKPRWLTVQNLSPTGRKPPLVLRISPKRIMRNGSSCLVVRLSVYNCNSWGNSVYNCNSWGNSSGFWSRRAGVECDNPLQPVWRWLRAGAFAFAEVTMRVLPPSRRPPYLQPASLAVHNWRDIFFNLEVPGDYVFKNGVPRSCPSIALMFGVGDDATYDDMGGSKQSPNNCSSESCHGYDVDIMHFTISTAIPGRLYEANLLDNVEGTGADRYSVTGL